VVQKAPVEKEPGTKVKNSKKSGNAAVTIGYGFGLGVMLLVLVALLI
jgi:glycerol uptake facilitator-like aquaporin